MTRLNSTGVAADSSGPRRERTSFKFWIEILVGTRGGGRQELAVLGNPLGTVGRQCHGNIVGK